MDFNVIMEFVTQQGIWCALFVWLFYTSRQESSEREAKLTAIIENYGKQLEQISAALERIDRKIDEVEEEMQNLEADEAIAR